MPVKSYPEIHITYINNRILIILFYLFEEDSHSFKLYICRIIKKGRNQI